MAYADEDDLNLDATRLVELTDSAAAPGVKDEALLTRLRVESEAIVNGILAGSGLLPFSSPPPALITFCTAVIWKYRIFVHRDAMSIPAMVADDYKMVMGPDGIGTDGMLEAIAQGQIDLGTGVPNLAGVPEVETSPARGWTPRDCVR